MVEVQDSVSRRREFSLNGKYNTPLADGESKVFCSVVGCLWWPNTLQNPFKLTALRKVQRVVVKKRGNPVIRYLKETRSELKKVVWPSREETAKLTMIVIAVTVVMSISLGLIDYILARLFGLIIR